MVPSLDEQTGVGMFVNCLKRKMYTENNPSIHLYVTKNRMTLP